MNPDLRALLEEANRLRRQYPNEPLKNIDAWIRENAPDVQSYADLRNRILLQEAQGRSNTPAEKPSLRTAARNAAAGLDLMREAVQTQTPVPGMARSAIRGATFNFDDDIARALNIRTAPGQMYSPQGEAQFRAYQQANPGLDAMMSMAGSLPTTGLLGGAVKNVVARQAAKSAPEALTWARVAQAEGTVPAMLRGGAIGGATAGVSAFGDDRPASEVVGATALGTGLGVAIPGVLGGVSAAARVISPRFSAAQVARESVEQTGNLRPGPGGVPVAGDPITVRQRIGDLLNPERVKLRTEAGLARRAVEQQALEASGRGGSMTPVDLDPTANNLMLGQAVNAIRQNPAAAGLAGVEALGQRGTQTGALVRGDIADAYAAGGITPPLVRSPTVGMDARNVRMASAIEGATGGAPNIKGPTLAGKPQASTARWSVDTRAVEIEETTKAFGRSPEGYGGLQPTIQAGVAGQGTGPGVLDEAAARLQGSNYENATDADTRTMFAQLIQNVRRLQGGPQENIPVWMEDAQKVLRDIKGFLKIAKADKTPGERNVAFVGSGLIEDLEYARDAITKYADDGFVGQNGQRFSQISRRYAQGMDDSRAVRAGVELFDGTYVDPIKRIPVTETRHAKRILDEMSPSERQNAYQGILSRQIEKLRAGNSADDATESLNTLLNKAGGEYRQNELLKAAFPSKTAYQKAVNQFVLMDAADQGVAAFRNTNPAQVQAAFDRLKLAGPAAEQEFKARLVGALEDQLSSPKAVQEFVRSAGEDVLSDTGEWMTKFRIVLGKKGANEMRQRILLQARMQNAEESITAAATNTAATPEFSSTMAHGQGNPPLTNPITTATSIVRPALRRGTRRATKTELAKLLTQRGQAGVEAFNAAVRAASAPVNVPRAASTSIPAAAGYLLPNTIFGRPIPER